MLQYPAAHVIIYSVCLEQEKAQRQIDGFSREQFSVQAAFKYWFVSFQLSDHKMREKTFQKSHLILRPPTSAIL